MMIRCTCGNDTIISPGANPGYFLNDTSWFDAATNEIRCPKCKSARLPLELIDASGGTVKVRIVPGRTIQKKHAWS